ncbi:ammonium transporter [Rhodovulum sulfidophilum]|uniref:ammonium transporter n=1 Tax=Rhodovulum sulfidophilum TaxID=35806 RepID=UPI0019229606|nr:ammonium transporter [Rhodovulum sulfidophilum]MBL3574874.1 ammonium transporter [Rhodovulum sulfidophilum]MCE8433192.1 ammonium transporter [Rhodovulum sulfidophilum]MCF4118266.1 ammonium transporter [Rhodovulum sulfidophilum]
MANIKHILGLAALTATAAALPALAQEVAEAAPIMDKGDTAWMMTATILVLFMTMPGIALFYGGLVRQKNMLSVLMQCTLITAMMMVIWVFWGYSFAFGDSTSPFWGGLSKLFLSGVTPDSTAATFTDAVIPEYVFIAFQMTFAVITPALIVGAFAERMKFSAVLLFILLWATFAYFPIAHMVWAAPTQFDAENNPLDGGFLFNLGAMDFAGGTVVHINAGIAALIGAIMVGPRIGLGKENMAPHSMTLTMVGASMLWIGWFGFNAGSNLEANGIVGLPFINTFVATAAAILSWSAVEALTRGKASMLGAASGMVAGLVAITPACGNLGPMGAILLGLIVSPICYFFVASVKQKFGYDDALDVFGVHGVGGIVGALGTGLLGGSMFGGTGDEDYSTIGQTIIQAEAVLVTIVWCGVVSLIAYKIVDMIVGLRVDTDSERQGLDLTSHGESAYHS